MDTVAVRLVEVLAVTFTLTIPSLLPKAGSATEHQPPLLVQLASQCVLEKTRRVL